MNKTLNIIILAVIALVCLWYCTVATNLTWFLAFIPLVACVIRICQIVDPFDEWHKDADPDSTEA